MIIAGFIPQSLVDYPDKISSVIFLPGCNFRCGFCHNKSIVLDQNPHLNIDNVLKAIKIQSSLIDSVVISGGEPTIYNDLPDLCKKLKELNLFIKLDTNGSNPKMIKDLIQNNLIDYIAMDLKAPFDLYDILCKTNISQDVLLETINIIMNSNLDYEFRTTVIPEFITPKKLQTMLTYIKGAKLYVLQQFKPNNTLDDGYNYLEATSIIRLEELAEYAKKYVKKVDIRY